jgi:hypothetical protein
MLVTDLLTKEYSRDILSFCLLFGYFSYRLLDCVNKQAHVCWCIMSESMRAMLHCAP